MSKNSEKQRVLIAGAGAIGLYFGARLHAAGYDVTFWVSPATGMHIENEGIELNSVAGDLHIAQPNLLRRGDAPSAPYDIVIYTCKAEQLADAMSQSAQLLHAKSCLLSLQNGLGSEERIAQAFPYHPVLGGTAFICAERRQANHVLHTAAGRLRIGTWNTDNTREVAAADILHTMFNYAKVTCELSTDIRFDLWHKLLWNASFNVVTTLSATNVGTLLAIADGEAMIREAMQEVLAVAHAEGIMLPPTLIEQNIANSRGMGAFRTSMLVDRDHNRRVEIEAISGEILKRADKHAISMPLQSMFYRLLSFYNMGCDAA